jgi:WD40 repeat protein
VRFVDLVSGKVTRASGRQDPFVAQATFAPDGRTAITGGADGSVVVWDVATAAAKEILHGDTARIAGMAVSREGATLYTGGLDGKVLIWDLAGTRRLGRPFVLGPGNPDNPRFALSSDGRVLAAGHADGTVTLVDARTLARSPGFHVVPRGPVQGMGFVPGGRTLVVGGGGGFLALLDAGSNRVVARLHGHEGSVYTPTFSADGRLMATASDDNTVRLWTLPSGRPVGPPLRRAPAVEDVSLSPDGKLLAITSEPGGVEILDVATRRRRASLRDAATVSGFVRFTPDGRFLMGSSWKGWARLWSTATWRPTTRRFAGHAGPVIWQSISPDGRTLATGSTDGAIRLWDLSTQQQLGAPLPGLPNSYVVPQFTPDGAHLFAIYAAGRGYRWDVRPSSWARYACAVAGRSLTRAEWADALPERSYSPACAR